MLLALLVLLVLRAQLALPARAVLQARLAQPDRVVLQARRVCAAPPAQRAIQAQPAWLVLLARAEQLGQAVKTVKTVKSAQQVFKALRDHKDRREQPANAVYRAPQALPAQQVLQAHAALLARRGPLVPPERRVQKVRQGRVAMLALQAQRVRKVQPE